MTFVYVLERNGHDEPASYIIGWKDVTTESEKDDSTQIQYYMLAFTSNELQRQNEVTQLRVVLLHLMESLDEHNITHRYDVSKSLFKACMIEF